jgi:hypothetical protein
LSSPVHQLQLIMLGFIGRSHALLLNVINI